MCIGSFFRTLAVNSVSDFLLDSQLKLQNQTLLLPFCTHSTGCQCPLVYSTKYPPFVKVPHQILVLNTCPKSCKFMHHLDNSIPPVTITFFVCPLSKQKPLVKLKDPFHMQALPSGTNFHMTSEIQSKTSFRKALKTCLFAVHY